MSSEFVFIMYSNKDARAVQDFADKLVKAGANIWIDTINLANLGVDQDEEEVMEQALLSAKLVLVMTSKNALNDQFVRNDKRFARENDKKLMLVKLDACDLSKKMRWRNLPVVDLTADSEKAVETVLAAAGISRPQKTTEKVTEPTKNEVSRKAAPTDTAETKIAMKDEQAVSETEKAASREVLMLNDIKDDIEFYKFKMKEQIKNSKFNMRLGIALAIVILVGAFMIPELVEAVQGIQDKIQWAGGLIGGGLPTTFSFSSLNSTKEKQKRLDGIQLFERKISRLERGIVPLTQAELLTLEDDFSLYINA